MTLMNVPQERRKYIRLPLKCILRCSPFAGHGSELWSGEVTTATKNISAGGILFESRHPYELGALLQVEADVPGWEKFKTEFYKEEQISRSLPVVILVSVVRVEAIEIGRKYDIGAAFVGIDRGHQGALVKYIKSRVKE
ncbi:MAG: PilZ domain-containing protein [Candidatus Omnitrophica bacterium]|nr:PilZ domain-containing protein [Candidatus Omnitrophota bacterium]